MELGELGKLGAGRFGRDMGVSDGEREKEKREMGKERDGRKEKREKEKGKEGEGIAR